MDIKDKYQRYILFDDPIVYIPQNLQQSYDDVNKRKYALENIPNLDEKYEQELKQIKTMSHKFELYLYPCLMKDCLRFYWCIDCLLQEKNVGFHTGFSPKDIVKMIKMSYLDYIVFISNETNNFVIKLQTLLSICCKVKLGEVQIYKDKDNHIQIKIKDLLYGSKDIDEIREIICYQNGIDLPDESIQPDLKRTLEKARAFARKQQSKHAGTLDDEIVCVQVAMYELDKKKIKEMPLRTFQRIFLRYNKKLQYQILKQAEMSGMVKFEKPIEEWTDNFDRTGLDKYKDLMMDSEKFQDKINDVNKHGVFKKEEK